MSHDPALKGSLGACSILKPWAAAALLMLATLSSCDRATQSLALPLSPSSMCSGPDYACLNAGASTLDLNGIKLIHKRIPGHPSVALRVLFDRGALDAARRSGIQYWSEALGFSMLLRNGSSGDDSVTWPAEWESLGAAVSGTGASLDYTYLALEAPLPNWQSAWALLSQAISHPYEATDEIAFESNADTQNAAIDADDPDSAAASDAWSRLFRHHPYNLSNDDQVDLGQISLDDVSFAWELARAPSALTLVVVGDVALEDAATEVQNGVADWSSSSDEGALPADPAASDTEQDDVAILSYPNSPTWHVRSYFEGPLAGDPDHVALMLGVRVLDERLFREVRDRQGLAYTVGASLAFTRQTYGSLWLSTDSPGQALPLVQGLIADLKSTGPTPEELETARARLRTDILSGAETPSGQAALLGDWELTAGSRRGVDVLLRSLEDIASAEVSRAVSTYLAGAKTTAAGPDGRVSEDALKALF